MRFRSKSEDDAILLKGPLTEENKELLRRPIKDLVVIRHVYRDSVVGLGVDSSFEIRRITSKNAQATK